MYFVFFSSPKLCEESKELSFHRLKKEVILTKGTWEWLGWVHKGSLVFWFHGEISDTGETYPGFTHQ